MPNYVKNIIIAKDFELLKSLLLNEKGNVDFNKIKPMPKDLNIESGSASYGNFLSEDKDVEKDLTDILDKIYNEDNSLTQDEFVSNVKVNKEFINMFNKGRLRFDTEKEEFSIYHRCMDIYIRGYYNNKLYGYTDWYNWCIDNWGTKWNACDTFVTEDLFTKSITFDTAWSMPEPIFIKLAEKIEFLVLWADEDLGINCGLTKYYKDKDGTVHYMDLMGESDALARYVWEEYPEYNEEDYPEGADEAKKKKDDTTVGFIESYIREFLGQKE